jgi:predicted protein tyrosine phosphatase
MSAILITPFSAVGAAVRRHRPSHIVTLLDPQTAAPTPPGIAPSHHLRLGIDDISEPIEGSIAPTSDHVANILSFAQGWGRSAPLLVHCWAGISRSTAAAYIMLCDLHGPGHEDAIARALRGRAAHAQPNKLMIRHADMLLNREGRMIAAVEAMGPGRIVWEGEVVKLPLTLAEL